MNKEYFFRITTENLGGYLISHRYFKYDDEENAIKFYQNMTNKYSDGGLYLEKLFFNENVNKGIRLISIMDHFGRDVFVTGEWKERIQLTDKIMSKLFK